MNLILPIYSLFILTLLLIVYFSKKRINTDETKLYCNLMIISAFNIIFNIVGIYLGYNKGSLDFLYVLNHLDLPLYFWWVSILFLYLTYIYNIDSKKYNKIKKIILTINSIFTLISIFLPFEVIINETAGYAMGICVDFVYTVCGIYLIFCIILSFLLVKKNNIKKVIPVFLLLILGIISVLIQKNIPSLILIPAAIVFVELIMYFTIENPDMKMLKEIQQSKEFAEQANNEKAMFLYNMSQEIKTPVKAIEQRCEELLKEQDINEIIDGIKDIKFASKKLETTINGTLDMSRTQASSIEIKVSKYNSKILFKELVSISRVNMKDKALDFRINIDDAIPEYLMGDSIRIKQIITTIMNNAIKHTEKGFIEFNVSSVIKHDMCRLIMTIEDSGKGIESHKLETLFYNMDEEENENLDNTKVDNTRESLSVIKILTNLIGGTVIVNSELGKGSKFTVVLDQQIVEEKTNTMIAIEKLSSNKRILVVDDEEESIKQIVKVLNKYDINVDTVMWGQECLEKIRKKQKYDLILLDEDMPKLNGIKTFEKLKIEDNFNIPVVIMIDSKHIDYKERYLYNGFSSCIVKPIKKQEVDKILKKYLKLDE